MILRQDKTKAEEIKEMLDQIEGIFSDLRWEYLDMSRRVDEATERISELEAENLRLEDVLDGTEAC